MNILSSLASPSPSLGRVAGSQLDPAGGLRGATTQKSENTFQSVLSSVSQLQSEAQELQKQVQLQNPDVTLEQAMVAMQKAQIGFQATLHVRNRMVQAYSDIMNMQV